MKNAKKALAVVETVEPKATETQTPKPEPDPPVTRQLAVLYYRRAISEIQEMIDLIDRHPLDSEVRERARYDAQSLADAMFLHQVLVDANGNHMIDIESPMVGAMLYNLGIDAEMLRSVNVEEA